MPNPSHPALRPRSVRALKGPNVWSRHPVLEVEIETAGFLFQDWQAADALLHAQKLEGITLATKPPADPVAAWLAEAMIKIQRAGLSPVWFHEAHEGTVPHGVLLVVEFEEELLGRAALEFALRWLNALSCGEALDLAQEWEAFTDYAYDVRLGNSTRPAAHAAAARGIPFYRLDTESLVQLGQGCRQRRIQRSMTQNTSSIAKGIAGDKDLTKRLLSEMGIPVPRGRLVTDAEDACLVAQEVGWPVVVKPKDGDYGNGVTMRIMSEQEVRPAYAEARHYSEDVLVEHHVEGKLFRLLVIGGRLVAAVMREPYFVVGDGKQTLLQLIERVNDDHRRGPEVVSPFQLALRKTGQMPKLTEDDRAHDSVPAPDETVLLKYDIYLKNGGKHYDETDIVHPELARMAADAAAIVGLDIAGLDVIARDLALSPQEQDFVVLEVNDEPALALHLDRFCIPERPVGEAIVEALFATPEAARVPVTVVLGDAEAFAMAREMARSRKAGLASQQGAWLQDHPLGKACGSLWAHASRLWCHPRTEAVVIHVTVEDVLNEGLPFDRCDELIEVAPSREAQETTLHQRARECVRRTVQGPTDCPDRE